MRRIGLTSLGVALLSIGCAGIDSVDQTPRAAKSACAARALSESEAATAYAKAEKLAPEATLVDRVPGSVALKVYAHVIYDDSAASAASGLLTEAQVKEQIAHLNDVFSGKTGGHNSAYRFELAGIDFTNNRSWFHVVPNTATETEMKSALHRGGRKDLNLYFVDVDRDLYGEGWASYPWTLDEEPRALNLLKDGVVVDFATRPGGSEVPYDEGDTAAHEVGHWMGLLHTFQGECDGKDDTTVKGDWVLDTPREAGPTRGCPAPKSVDSCPSTPARPDPVENLMDFTDDACRYAFTKGQARRANKFMKADRENEPPPGNTCGDGVYDPATEQCDTAIAHGQPHACPTSPADCNDNDTCTTDEVIGTACQAQCFHGAITDPKGGDGCCPAGGNAGNDSDCAVTCGDGVVSPGETCDIKLPGSCPTSCDDGQACTTDQLVNAGTCQAKCVYTPITTPANGDGCCPAGGNAGNDSDCGVVCGDGVVSPGETCDTKLPGSCPTSCDDGQACTTDQLVNAGSCQAKCVTTPITTPASGDGCCPAGANNNNDSDCAPKCGNGEVESGEQCDPPGATCDSHCQNIVSPTAFRISEMYLRDPHVFVALGGCTDLTNGDVGSLSVNGQLNAQLQRDGNSDGYFDMSPVLVFRPLAQHSPTTGGDFLLGHCGFTSGSCSANGADVYEGVADNQETGTCVSLLAGTVKPYSPAVSTPINQCFATRPQTLPINIQGTSITLHDATIGAIYQSDPATGMTTGLIRGFVTEADADATIVPLPIFGDTPLSKLLPGGKDNCLGTGGDDRDNGPGGKGWYFYLNFSAVRVAWTE